MHEKKRHRPCPVCLGTDLSKLPVPAREVVATASTPPEEDLVLDHCERCGGMWFDAGEAERLRTLRLPAIWRARMLRDDVHLMACHSCGASMDRDAARCEACRRQNEVDCPVCARPMKRKELQGLFLDFCVPCRGVWFDRTELSEIWLLKLDRLERRRGGGHLAAEVALNVAGQGPAEAVLEGVFEAVAEIVGSILS